MKGPEGPAPGGWWTRWTRAALILFCTVGLVSLAANITVIVRLTRTWTDICTVDLVVAAVYAVVVVRAVTTPAGKRRR